MNFFQRCFAITLLALLITSCSYDDISEKFIPKEEAAFAEDYISKLRAGDFDYIKSKLSPELLPQINDELLHAMVSYFRSGELISVEIIGSDVYTSESTWEGNFTFEYQFESGWNVANAALRKVNDSYEVIGLNVYQTELSQKEINAFTLTSRTPLQYFVLFLALVIPIFILFTLIVCIRTPLARRKWLWIIFILLGVGSIAVDWTTGAYALQLLSVNLLGASAMATGPAAPWVISASVPLGAIVFWFRRKQYMSASTA